MKCRDEPAAAAAAENADEVKKFVSRSSSHTEHWNQPSEEPGHVGTLLCRRRSRTTTQTSVHLAHLTETGHKRPLFPSWRGRRELGYAAERQQSLKHE